MGSAQGKLPLYAIAELPITLPPLSEQEAIAQFLGSLDDKIDLNRRMNETLEEMARAIFKSWFVDFDLVRAKIEGHKPVGMDSSTARMLPTAFRRTSIGEIPIGWREGTIGEIADNPRCGVRPEEIDPSTPYIGLEHMPRRCIALAAWGQAEELESGKFRFKKGEILFGKLRLYFHKVGVAVIDGICSTDILVVTPQKSDWFGFLLGHISSVEFVNHTDAASSGTKMPRTNWNDMARYRVALPPESLARSYSQLVQPFIERIGVNILGSRTLVALRDALLPKLLSGEIRVKEAEKLVGAKVP